MPRTPFRSRKSSSKKPRTACQSVFNDPTARVPNARPKHASSRSAIRCEQLRSMERPLPQSRHCTRSLPATEVSTCNRRCPDQPGRTMILRQYWEQHPKAFNTDGHQWQGTHADCNNDTIKYSWCTNTRPDSASYGPTLRTTIMESITSSLHLLCVSATQTITSHSTPTFYPAKRDPCQRTTSTEPGKTWYLE